MTSILCPRAVLGSLNPTVSTSSRSFGSSSVQTLCPGLQFRAPVGVSELQGQKAGKVCLRCTALHMEDGSSLSKNPRRHPPSRDFKETKPKLYRGWYPGQRTQAPPECSRSTVKDSEVSELPFLEKLICGEETTVITKYYRRPESNRENPSQQREFLFDAEDDDEYLSDGEGESDNDEDDEDNRFDKAENNQFTAESRDDFLRNPDTDLNCKHFARCSGCVIDVGLDQPPIMNEAKAFFAGRGVPSFSLAPGPLVEWRCRAKLAVRGTSEIPR